MNYNLRTNYDLYLLLKSSPDTHLDDYKKLFEMVTSRLDINFCESELNTLKNSIRMLCLKLRRKWKQSNRTEKIFLENNNSWLHSEFNWPHCIRLKIKDMVEKTEFIQYKDTQELMCSTIRSMYNNGLNDVARILEHLQENPEFVIKIRKILDDKFKPVVYSKEKALSIYTSLNLSKSQYIILRDSVSKEELQLFPSYYKIQQAKNDCYPRRESITVTETVAQINLQELLDHTVSRILKYVQTNESGEFTLISKCGFDGASGQNTYKQKFSDETAHDSSIFMTALVPLKLYHKDESDIIWTNSRPSSTFFCRPIKFEFIKESTEVIKNEMKFLQRQIDTLILTKYKENITIRHIVCFTMVDGKVCQTLTETTSSMVCYICKAKPSEMNNFQKLEDKIPNEDNYKFGISPLHAWIRSFECLLHISYNLEFKKWSAKTAEQKEMKESKKRKVQNLFKTRLGLLVDIVKQGHGTTNDGNTARKFFENAEISAEITSIDVDLIKRIRTILHAIASGEKINLTKFKIFAKETANLYVSLYEWYYMPVSLHKILFHGEGIIKHALLPIGQLSEEASEARNKDFRKYRETRSRKFCREASNEDILHNMLISSDPFISSIRPFQKRQTKNLLPETLELLELTPEIELTDATESDTN